MTARLRETYKEKVFPALQEKFQYKNVMEVPKLEKVTINMGLGEAKENAKILETAVKEIGLITGQRPVVTKAKKFKQCSCFFVSLSRCSKYDVHTFDCVNVIIVDFRED